MKALLTAIAFVLIWSTGLVTARIALDHASIGAFLTVRMALTAVILAMLAAIRRETWPKGLQVGWHLGAGALLNGVYLCLAYWAILRGLPVGIMSLLGSSQPLVVVAASAALFGEFPGWRVLIGMMVATCGVIGVLVPVLDHGGLAAASSTIAVAAGAVIGMAAGTMIQQGHSARDPVLISSAYQNLGGIPVAVLGWILSGEARWDGMPALYLALGWSIIGLSAIGVPLIVSMVRRQGPTRMSMLLLLVPPLAALESRVLFGEMLSELQVAGFVLALGGVLLTRWKGRADVAS